MQLTIDEARERARRAQLHRTIGALERKLEFMGRPKGHFEWVKRKRLEHKLERLRGELAQARMSVATTEGPNDAA